MLQRLIAIYLLALKYRRLRVSQAEFDKTNKRTDKYGGSIENRACFMLEALEGILSVADSSQVAIRLSPFGVTFECTGSNPRETYGYVVKKLSDYNLACLHVVEPFGWEVTGDLVPEGGISPVFRPMYNGPLIATGGFDRAKAIKVVEDGTDDMIGFGRDFIGTPDLVERLKLNKPFNEYNQKTFYVCFDTPVDSYPTGYTDYPNLED